MTEKTIRNGQAEYGTVHVQEDEMRAAEVGVFEPKSGEAGLKRKKAPAPANKAAPAPANKAARTVKGKANG